MPSEAAPIIIEAISTKGKILLIVNHHKFHLQKSLSTWEERKNCKSFFRTSGESSRILIREHSGFSHNHEPVYDRKLQS